MTVLLLALALCCAIVGLAAPARAHGLSSAVYVDLSADGPTHVRAKLGLEYDLMITTVATYEHDDPLYRQGQPAWDRGDYTTMATVAEKHRPTLSAYILRRFTISAHGNAACSGRLDPDVTVDTRDGVPYAEVTADFTCPARGETEKGHVVTSTLFPDAEKFVTGTTTIVVYDVDGRSGSATLDASHPSFSTEQNWYQRFWEFFRLGALHLLTGIDHILFLLALIAGSRRLREVVLAATTFTLAHSVTFILAALGVVRPPAAVIEPVIALSIAVVAAWPLVRLWRRGSEADELDVSGTSHFALDRAGWGRLAVVFGFGLIHGLGFASALGITEAFSWQLLWSLLVFNLGIEAVQITVIAALFPLLALLRRRSHVASLWLTGTVSAGVTAMGLIWFVGRLLGVDILEAG